MIPEGIEYIVAGDYSCHVAGRTSYESGLVEKSTVSRRGGKYTGKSSTAAVNLENPMTIDNSADFVVYDRGMHMIRLNENFKTPTEAKEYFMQRYAESIGMSKGK